VKDVTPHAQDMIDLVAVIRTAIGASGQFEEKSTGFRNCMTLFIRTAGGRDLAVSVSDVEFG
jgi:hypothetical protein